MAEKYSMKDDLFNGDKVYKIASEIKAVYADFEQEKFEKETVEKFPELELKSRIFHIRDMLEKYLPDTYTKAVSILIGALPPELDPSKCDDDFGDFIYAPYGEFVAEFGCREEHLERSFHALQEMTKRFSMEYGIRAFINTFPTETYAMLEACSKSENYHQRRLASEGLRLKLPWALGIDIDYHDNIPILENLYHDKCRFVTRSVANHLNDISKIDAPLVLETLKRWQTSKKQQPKEMDFIINHALRTRIKEGDVDTMAFLGYRANPSIMIKGFAVARESIMIGEALEFSFMLEAQKEEGLIVDYILHYRTKAGKHNQKVHKIKKLHIQEGEAITLSKKHLFKANMSTRKLYEGEHKIELQINGRVYASAIFNLSCVE